MANVRVKRKRVRARVKKHKRADTPRFIRSQAPEFGIRIVYMTASLVCQTKEGNDSTTNWLQVLSTKATANLFENCKKILFIIFSRFEVYS